MATSYVTVALEFPCVSLEADFIVIPSDCMSSSVIIGIDVLGRDGIRYVRTRDGQSLQHLYHGRLMMEPWTSFNCFRRVSLTLIGM